MRICLSATFGRRRLVGMAVGMLGLMHWPAAASADAHAEAAVSRVVDQIVTMLSQNELSEEQSLDALGQIVDREADLDRLGRLVLGRHWRRATEAQQSEYQSLFRKLMLRRFVGHLNAYTGADRSQLAGMFEVTGSRPVGKQDVLVRSRVTPSDRAPIVIDWRLRQQDGGEMVIIDMIVEGVSLLISQRSEFSSVIERHGMDGLLAEMRTRAGSARSAASRGAGASTATPGARPSGA